MTRITATSKQDQRTEASPSRDPRRPQDSADARPPGQLIERVIVEYARTWRRGAHVTALTPH
jgi:hypothetical protein